MESIADTREFDELYKRYWKAIYTYVYSFVNNPEQAEDLTQETFTKAFKGFSSFDPTLDAAGWFYRIAYTTTIDLLRRRQLIAWFPLEDGDSTSVAAASADPQERYVTAELVRLTLECLPGHYRALLLSTQEGYTYQEIAAAKQITEGAVKNQASRARQLFREHYQALIQESS